jgi:hypothetical protein
VISTSHDIQIPGHDHVLIKKSKFDGQLFKSIKVFTFQMPLNIAVIDLRHGHENLLI